MRIHEIIRQKRLEKGLTQEQAAQYLGVTAPAVNKWEKGVSYPDITILPALARLLGTDLNTLLSFREDLTVQEVTAIVQRLSDISRENGFEAAYAEGMKQVLEYPNCHLLLLNVALALEGALMNRQDLKGKLTSNFQKEQEEIQNLYCRAMESTDPGISRQAKAMLIAKYRDRKEYDKAQEMVDTLSDPSPIDKRTAQIGIWMAQERYSEAGKLAEQKFLALIGDLCGTLLTLSELALKEERYEDAKEIAERYRTIALQFDMWQFGGCAAHLPLYVALKDWDRFLETLESMFRSLKKEWSAEGSPLFHYTDFDKNRQKKGENDWQERMKDIILNSIYQDEETAFLKDDPRFQEMLKRVEK